MKKIKYNVATPVLLAQGEALVRQLNAPATAPRREKLKNVGIGDAFTNELKDATSGLFELEGKQERMKSTVSNETREDREAAEAGYRYKLVLDARVRTYLARNDEKEDYAQIFRFGKLRNPRARGVAYELRVVLPEAAMRVSKLAAVGIDDAFIEEGKALLEKLDDERQETFESVEERKVLTKELQDAELVLSRLMSELVAADDVVSLENPEDEPLFVLNVIRTEEARLGALTDARRQAASSAVLLES
ncbi:MAG: hypothetical protein GY822_23660 [Deltaproteobacteria bacterium]|nr:hypothetical protein [Deltaproteobacteria bacterium]